MEFVSDWPLLICCICPIHEDRITRQTHIKQKFGNYSAALGVYTKYLISPNHFHVIMH